MPNTRHSFRHRHTQADAQQTRTPTPRHSAHTHQYRGSVYVYDGRHNEPYIWHRKTHTHPQTPTNQHSHNTQNCVALTDDEEEESRESERESGSGEEEAELGHRGSGWWGGNGSSGRGSWRLESLADSTKVHIKWRRGEGRAKRAVKKWCQEDREREVQFLWMCVTEKDKAPPM